MQKLNGIKYKYTVYSMKCDRRYRMTEKGFAANLRALRLEKKETQQQLENAIGVPRSTISKWENGLLEADHAALKAVADHYRITIDQLLR